MYLQILESFTLIKTGWVGAAAQDFLTGIFDQDLLHNLTSILLFEHGGPTSLSLLAERVTGDFSGTEHFLASIVMMDKL